MTPRTTAFDVNRSSLDPGILLLEASAGTGKTWSLTSVAVRLVLEQDLKIDRMLLVTFTRAATDELRQRLRARLRECEGVLRGQAPGDPFLAAVFERWGADADALDRITAARRDVDLARVRTIHGFCLDVLAEGAFEAGLPLEGTEQTEGDDLLNTAWRDTLRACVQPGEPLVIAGLSGLKVQADQFPRKQGIRSHDPRTWLPVLEPLEDALVHFRDVVKLVDPACIGAFLDGGPRSDWTTAYKNPVLRELELLREGVDPDDPDAAAACFFLTADRVTGALNKGGRGRFPGSELEQALSRTGPAIEQFLIALEQNLYARTLERYRQLKDRHALIDHDDVISRTRTRLMDPSSGAGLARRIAAQFEVALVDEFQDTDADQWEIFRRIFGAAEGARPSHLLLLVGDPKQAIYRFRGADIFAYLAAREVADRRETLTHNWRSTPPLVDAVNSLFGRRPDESFALAEIEFEPVEAGRTDAEEPVPMEVVWVDPGPKPTIPRADAAVLDQLAADVVRRRAELGERKADAPGRLAVLVYKHAQARAVMHRLRESGIDVVLARGGDIHASDAMGEWRVILRALLDPSHLRLQRRARVTRLWGAPLSALGEGPATFGEVELIAELGRIWKEVGIAPMGARLLRERRTVERWLGEVDGERMVTDLRHALELLNREESRRGFTPEALLRWAEAEARLERPDSEERLLRLDRESDAVQVFTNFTSKGLQFDTVFLPWAWWGREPAKEPPFAAHDPVTGTAVLDFTPDAPLRPQAVLEELASALRIHYVELTRAMERCVVYLVPSSARFPVSPTAFLLARGETTVPEERALWAVGEVGALRASLAQARSRIEERLEGVPSIGFRVAASSDAQPANWPRPALLLPAALEFPAARRGALVPWRQLSYTALVRSLHGSSVGLPDADAPLTDRADPSDAAPTRNAEGIFGFARGARAGICLHELLEHAEFTRATNSDDRARIAALLATHDLDEDGDHPGEIDPIQVCLDLTDRLRAELIPFATGPFAELTASARLDEWEFRLPVIDLIPRRLAALMREHWSDEPWIRQATDRMDHLPDRRVEGMLGGFIDLLFVEDGRWCVLDWKSNDLGRAAVDYGAAAMQRAMVEHDYVVQLILYTVAVHRFLRTRLPDYDYDRHIAGASYAFLRGFNGDATQGWCNVRPPRALIEAVDALFGGGRS